MNIGKLGVWASLDGLPGPEALAFAQRVEARGYETLWMPESRGRNVFVSSAWLLAGTKKLIVAPGIANIYARDAVATASGQLALNELSGGRFLLGLGVSTFDGRALLALPAFIVLDQAWSLLSVSGTVLASRLASDSQGEGMGLFNTAAALASLVGAAIGGWIAQQAGYNAVWAFGIAGVGGALLLAVWLRSAQEAVPQAAPAVEHA